MLGKAILGMGMACLYLAMMPQFTEEGSVNGSDRGAKLAVMCEHWFQLPMGVMNMRWPAVTLM
jgi:hypothetical protein